ncbi:MAG: hypothetical protein ACTFAK_15865 [Candidatus Electronema sp. VV]
MKTLLTKIQDTFPLPEETVIPFREAEICYRAGAYRAALLFSYIGWGLTLRSRLLRAACPAGIPLEKWEKDIANLRREDEWDKKVFDLTQQKAPAPVFLVSEDLRHQVRYWKDRRNDCAHFKTNEIDHSHVESFWHFIFSNLGKFVPNGSAAALLNEIVLYFDPNFTPPNAPLDPLIERIPHCVEREELSKFFNDMAAALPLSIFDQVHGINRVNRVFDAVIRITDNNTVNALRDFLVNNEDYLVNLLRNFPQHVILLDQNPELVRCLWRKHLFSSYHDDIDVFAALLRADLIPQGEIDEANTRVFPRLAVGGIPSPAVQQILDQKGFFAAFVKEAFMDYFIEDFSWWNKHAKSISWYIESYRIPVEAVRAICSIFAKPSNPSGARNRLIELFRDNPAKRQEFEKIAQQEQLTLPEAIFGE